VATEPRLGSVTAHFIVIDADRQRDVAADAIAVLAASGLTLAVAESLTGGAVLADLVRIPGASAVLRGGVVAYDTALKSTVLGVPRTLLDAYGPVHPEVAVAMAEGVRVAAAVQGHPADLGVATTGAAGPDSQGGVPVGLVYVSVADASGAVVREHRFAGDRVAIRAQTVRAALELLCEFLPARESATVGNDLHDYRVTNSRLTTPAQVAEVTVKPSGFDSVTPPAHPDKKFS